MTLTEFYKLFRQVGCSSSLSPGKVILLENYTFSLSQTLGDYDTVMAARSLVRDRTAQFRRQFVPRGVQAHRIRS